MHGVDPDVVLRQLADERDLRLDVRLAQMPHVEVHVGAVLSLEHVPLLLFAHEALRKLVAWPELHRP